VIYYIGPTGSLFRRKRSALISLDKNDDSLADTVNMKYDWMESNTSKNGTNIKVLHLNNTQVNQIIANNDDGGTTNLSTILIPSLVAVIILIFVCCVILVLRKRRRKRHKPHVHIHRRNNLEPLQHESVIYKGNPNKPVTIRCGSSLELKQSMVVKGDQGKPSVRIKDTNIQKDKNIAKGNGTEV